MSSNSKVCVFIENSPNSDLEAAELVLALAAFDIEVEIIFAGLGLYWLMPQEPRKQGGKAAHKVLSALPMYGIENLYFLASDAAKLQFDPQVTFKHAKPINQSELGVMIAGASQCFHF